MARALSLQKISLERTRLETSKAIVLVTGVIFVVHMLLSALLIYAGYGENAIAMASAFMPVYLAVVAGYFGKAGFENIQKIRLLTDGLSGTEENYSNG
jgi:hypothetical protein